ncbi:phenylpyruvate tautomerase MIF-related protein [Synechococcus sp. UW86]|uniref:phenylpyruvate tautomerase MIF-related protein n=1 Tax=Synechococcus sp. UW86 TaxID=368491 RepID=UPI00210FE561|nr:phenylpyruvate tautomerase MIF-related protein [Synechococcus sp. UW86]
MPLINVRTSLQALKDGSALLQELSSELANQTGKPEAYVMTLLETGVPMTFAGSHEPCAYVEVKSIGTLGFIRNFTVCGFDALRSVNRYK